MSTPQHIHMLWHGAVSGNYGFNWDAISINSVVLITAAEGRVGTETPDRFNGFAAMEVRNIIPRPGRVEFKLEIDWERPLEVWTDITVFDATDPLGISHN
jgi:hypothetical protein